MNLSSFMPKDLVYPKAAACLTEEEKKDYSTITAMTMFRLWPNPPEVSSVILLKWQNGEKNHHLTG